MSCVHFIFYFCLHCFLFCVCFVSWVGGGAKQAVLRVQDFDLHSEIIPNWAQGIICGVQNWVGHLQGKFPAFSGPSSE